MVDILSNGRLRLGVGMGNYAPEFELFGLEKKTQVSRFEECIDLLQQRLGRRGDRPSQQALSDQGNDQASPGLTGEFDRERCRSPVCAGRRGSG